jgi:hypothetical protein
VVEDQDGCSTDTAELKVEIWMVGVETSLPVEVQMYPNPVSGVLTIDTGLGSVVAEVFNMQGEKVFTTREHFIDFASMESGIFVVRLRNALGETIGSAKIMKN